LPLFYFPALAKVFNIENNITATTIPLSCMVRLKMPRFKAEKVCADLGLNFGMPRNKMLQLLRYSTGGSIFEHSKAS
jgi:hypothetical protein